MWLEINGALFNFDLVLKVETIKTKNQIRLQTHTNSINIKFKNAVELDQAYFNLLAMLNSKPVDGFKMQK